MSATGNSPASTDRDNGGTSANRDQPASPTPSIAERNNSYADSLRRSIREADGDGFHMNAGLPNNSPTGLQATDARRRTRQLNVNSDASDPDTQLPDAQLHVHPTQTSWTEDPTRAELSLIDGPDDSPVHFEQVNGITIATVLLDGRLIRVRINGRLAFVSDDSRVLPDSVLSGFITADPTGAEPDIHFETVDGVVVAVCYYDGRLIGVRYHGRLVRVAPGSRVDNANGSIPPLSAMTHQIRSVVSNLVDELQTTDAPDAASDPSSERSFPQHVLISPTHLLQLRQGASQSSLQQIDQIFHHLRASALETLARRTVPPGQGSIYAQWMNQDITRQFAPILALGGPARDPSHDSDVARGRGRSRAPSPSDAPVPAWNVRTPSQSQAAPTSSQPQASQAASQSPLVQTPGQSQIPSQSGAFMPHRASSSMQSPTLAAATAAMPPPSSVAARANMTSADGSQRRSTSTTSSSGKQRQSTAIRERMDAIQQTQQSATIAATIAQKRDQLIRQFDAVNGRSPTELELGPIRRAAADVFPIFDLATMNLASLHFMHPHGTMLPAVTSQPLNIVPTTLAPAAPPQYAPYTAAPPTRAAPAHPIPATAGPADATPPRRRPAIYPALGARFRTRDRRSAASPPAGLDRGRSASPAAEREPTLGEVFAAAEAEKRKRDGGGSGK